MLFQSDNLVFQREFSFLKAMNLTVVGVYFVGQSVNDLIKIAMFNSQIFELLLNVRLVHGTYIS